MGPTRKTDARRKKGFLEVSELDHRDCTIRGRGIHAPVSMSQRPVVQNHPVCYSLGACNTLMHEWAWTSKHGLAGQGLESAMPHFFVAQCRFAEYTCMWIQ